MYAQNHANAVLPELAARQAPADDIEARTVQCIHGA